MYLIQSKVRNLGCVLECGKCTGVGLMSGCRRSSGCAVMYRSLIAMEVVFADPFDRLGGGFCSGAYH